MKIAIGCDHGATDLKMILTKHLEEISRARDSVTAHQRSLDEYLAQYEPVKGFENDSNVGLQAVIMKLQKKIEYEKTEYAKALTKYHALIETLVSLNVFLSDDEFKVFKYRYIDNMTFQDISMKLSFSERTIYRLHNSALQELENVSFLF